MIYYKDMETTQMTSEYRSFWDAAAVEAMKRAPGHTAEYAKWCAEVADSMIVQRTQRFGVAPQSLDLCKCGNRLVCDKCHCSPTTCQCAVGYTGI
jgi:hypothetical protein